MSVCPAGLNEYTFGDIIFRVTPSDRYRRLFCFLSQVSIVGLGGQFLRPMDRGRDFRILLGGTHPFRSLRFPTRKKDFLAAKADFVAEMVSWSGLDKLPAGATLLDVGCGIGGSSRILARDYGFAVTGVTISPKQVARAKELTPPDLNARFLVDDAMALSFPDESFDVVWSIEAGPHMPDKAVFAGELLRVLKPGGVLVVADWNQRDDRQKPLNFWERPVMRQLLDQWSHPAFASIEGFAEQLAATGLVDGEVMTADWTTATLPSWIDTIWQGVIRPQGWWQFGLTGLLKSVREVPTILLMRLAFGTGLCRFGMFRTVRAQSHLQVSQQESLTSVM